MSNKLFLVGALILFLESACVSGPIAAEQIPSIAFFRAIQDNAAYTKNPARYERLVVTDRAGKHEYYTDKRPAHVIHKSAIESVTVTTMENRAPTGAPTRESKSNSQTKRTRRIPIYYELNFKIRGPEGKQFSDFTEKNKQQVFETKVSEESIGLQEFDWPFEPDETGSLEFKIYILEHDRSNGKLQKILSSFKERVIWK